MQLLYIECRVVLQYLLGVPQCSLLLTYKACMKLDLRNLESRGSPRSHYSPEGVARMIGHYCDVPQNSHIQREGYLEHALNLIICCVSRSTVQFKIATLIHSILCIYMSI